MKSRDRNTELEPGYGMCVVDVSADEISVHMRRALRFLEQNRNDGGPDVKWGLEGWGDRQPAMSRVEGPATGIAAFLTYVYADDQAPTADSH